MLNLSPLLRWNFLILRNHLLHIPISLNFKLGGLFLYICKDFFLQVKLAHEVFNICRIQNVFTI